MTTEIVRRQQLLGRKNRHRPGIIDRCWQVDKEYHPNCQLEMHIVNDKPMLWCPSCRTYTDLEAVSQRKTYEEAYDGDQSI